MRWLIACERSGAIRRRMRARLIDAWSCDLEPADDGDPHHIQGDAIAAAYGQRWDGMIAHPECTYLANSGAKHLYAGMRLSGGPSPERWARMGAAAAFFLALWNAPIERIAIENPIMLGHPKRLFGIPEPTQTVQPFWFGDPAYKATCLWLKGLPPLVETNRLPEPVQDSDEHKAWCAIHREPPGPDRKRKRSETFPGIADACAAQWGWYGSDIVRGNAA